MQLSIVWGNQHGPELFEDAAHLELDHLDCMTGFPAGGEN